MRGETALGPEPAPCTRFSHLKSGLHLLPPGQASERLASISARPHTSVSSTPHPHPLRLPFFWPLFSSPLSFSEGTNLPILVITIKFFKKIIPPRGALGSRLPTPARLTFLLSFVAFSKQKKMGGGQPLDDRCSSVASRRTPAASSRGHRDTSRAAVNSPCLLVSVFQCHQ